MIMEQRWSTRSRIALDVDVFYEGAERKGCRTRDIGLGGVFLEIGKEAPPKDAMVELTFRLGKGTETSEHKIMAKVVRVTHDGVGLMFRDFDARAFRSLKELIHYTQGNSVH